MKIIFESIEKIGGLDVVVNFRCVKNGFDIDAFGCVSMNNVDYDKQFIVSIIKVDSLDDEPVVIKFSSLPDDVYKYIDTAIQDIIRQDIDEYNEAIKEWDSFFELS